VQRRLASSTLERGEVGLRYLVFEPEPPDQPVAARKEWDARRDWLRFTSGALGDATIKDDIKELLASGAEPETQDRYGRAALHAAAMLGQVELARFLLPKGADVNVRAREGRTPLMVSASESTGPTTYWGSQRYARASYRACAE
jgi:hypothetical protein